MLQAILDAAENESKAAGNDGYHLTVYLADGQCFSGLVAGSGPGWVKLEHHDEYTEPEGYEVFISERHITAAQIVF